MVEMKAEKLHDHVVKVFDELLTIYKELGFNVCLDCGKIIKNKNSGGVMILDGHGALFLCNNCTWARVEKLETWRKILGTKPRY